jgi:hypothetical protein
VSFPHPAGARCRSERGASLPNAELGVDQQRPAAFRHRTVSIVAPLLAAKIDRAVAGILRALVIVVVPVLRSKPLLVLG